MQYHLIRKIEGQVLGDSEIKVKPMLLEGNELEEKLSEYLEAFIEGTLDPELAGKKPDKFISNLKENRLGDFSKRYINLAYDGEKVIGILIALPENEGRYHIFSVHVAKEYRKKGVGTALILRCINDMHEKNVQEILIDVHEDNTPAYNLYRKYGFEVYDIE